MLNPAEKDVTRRELYNRVWREPMVNVAKSFGLSDRGLAKICERAGIPVPPRGYWAKKSAGKRVIRPPLLELGGNDSTERVRISPYWRQLKAIESEGEEGTPNAFKELAGRELQDAKSITVHATLHAPHPIVDKWLKEELRARESRVAYPHMRSNSEEPTRTERRRRRILSALFKALELRGFEAEQGAYRHDLFVKFERDVVKFELNEHIRQRRVRLTEEEQERRNTKQVWTQTREPSGELVLKITSGMPEGLDSSWRDQPDSPLEQRLHVVVVGFVVAMAYAGWCREEEEEAERKRWREAEDARKREELRKAELAKKRVLRLKARSWCQASEVRAYVAAVQTAVQTANLDVETDQLNQWSAWALCHADELDPITSNRALSVNEDEIEGEEEDPQQACGYAPHPYYGFRKPWWLR